MADDAALPLCTALRAGLARYSFATFRQDAQAGLVVSLIALPLAMALAIAVGLPPQHGLYTAIIAGIAAAVFGGSPTQVSGPTAAFVVIIAPIVTNMGLHGLIFCQLIAGIFLLMLGFARMGRFVEYVPSTVTTGFTAGIAVTIATLSLNDFLGLEIQTSSAHYVDKVITILRNISGMQPHELAVGMITLLTIVFLPSVTKRFPAAVAGIAAGTILAFVLGKNGLPVDTLLTRFSYVAHDGESLQGIPPYPPVFHLPGSDDTLFKMPDYEEFRTLLMPSVLIAALAALESLLSAKVADKLSGTKHDPNAELNGIGIANILSGLAAGIPATGAIARTAANIQAGARTPIASIIHAVLILIYVLALAPMISHIPMSALAALLLTVAWRMSHVAEFVALLKKGHLPEKTVLLATFLLTIFIDMVAGVITGLILYGLFYIKRKKGKKT